MVLNEGFSEINSIADRDRLATYPFYPAALGELELCRGRTEVARGHFEAAAALARSPMERRFLEQRISVCAGADRRQLAYYEEFWGRPR